MKIEVELKNPFPEIEGIKTETTLVQRINFYYSKDLVDVFWNEVSKLYNSGKKWRIVRSGRRVDKNVISSTEFHVIIDLEI